MVVGAGGQRKGIKGQGRVGMGRVHKPGAKVLKAGGREACWRDEGTVLAGHTTNPWIRLQLYRNIPHTSTTR